MGNDQTDALCPTCGSHVMIATTPFQKNRVKGETLYCSHCNWSQSWFLVEEGLMCREDLMRPKDWIYYKSLGD